MDGRPQTRRLAGEEVYAYTTCCLEETNPTHGNIMLSDDDDSVRLRYTAFVYSI